MSPNEIKLLTYIANSGKDVCTHEELIKHVWGDVSLKDFYGSLKVIVCYARGHLDHYDIAITSKRHVGYGIDPEHHATVRSILARTIKRKTGVDVPWAEVA